MQGKRQKKKAIVYASCFSFPPIYVRIYWGTFCTTLKEA